jgi:galactokinase
VVVHPPIKVLDAFTAACGRPPEGVWAAPGRVNLIGEHTDYNDGFVLPLALAQQTVAAAAVSSDGRTRVRSLQEPEDVVTFAAAEVEPGEVDGWGSYVAGVAWALRSSDHRLADLDIVVDSNVPVGAGLSSSAAIECAVAKAWVDLSGLTLAPTELARICQRAENDFVGAPTGVMDQMVSMHGRAGHAVFLDTRTLSVEHVPLDLATGGLTLLVIDTHAPHRHAGGEYADRRRACEQAAALLGVPALRDVGLADLDRLPLELLPRARHVVTENQRVLDVVALLRAGTDPREIGPFLTASHESLRDDFEVTVPEVDTAVDSLLEAGAHGARITGGGFGGCVIALIESAEAAAAVAAVEASYERNGFDPPTAFAAVASDGARRLAPS